MLDRNIDRLLGPDTNGRASSLSANVLTPTRNTSYDDNGYRVRAGSAASDGGGDDNMPRKTSLAEEGGINDIVKANEL